MSQNRIKCFFNDINTGLKRDINLIMTVIMFFVNWKLTVPPSSHPQTHTQNQSESYRLLVSICKLYGIDKLISKNEKIWNYLTTKNNIFLSFMIYDIFALRHASLSDLTAVLEAKRRIANLDCKSTSLKSSQQFHLKWKGTFYFCSYDAMPCIYSKYYWFHALLISYQSHVNQSIFERNVLHRLYCAEIVSILKQRY